MSPACLCCHVMTLGLGWSHPRRYLLDNRHIVDAASAAIVRAHAVIIRNSGSKVRVRVGGVACRWHLGDNIAHCRAFFG
jgi:hypothetical protein